MLSSRRVRYLIGSFLCFLLLLGFFQTVFTIFFATLPTWADIGEFVQALSVSARFAIRISILAILPLIAFAAIPRFHIARNDLVRRVSHGYLVTAATAVSLFYIFDYGNYSYLKSHVDASVFRFAGDTAMGLTFIWQTYPVIWLTIGLFVLIYLFHLALKKLAEKTLLQNKIHRGIIQNTAALVILSIAMFFGLLGTLYVGKGRYPLTDVDAFFSHKPEITDVAINPISYFVFSLFFSHDNETYDLDKTKQNFASVQRYLDLNDTMSDKINVERQVTPAVQLPKRPNVVLVLLESFGTNMMGISGNPLQLTPNLDRLAREGILFDRSYAVDGQTFESIFALLTGVPDITVKGASNYLSLKPMHSIINDFVGYDKTFFLGGDIAIGGLKSMIHKHLSDFKIFEGFKDSSFPVVDVWGVSDLSLFQDAVNRLSQSTSPFFAIIETASHHRPYSDYSNEDPSFSFKPVEPSNYATYGFSSEQEIKALRLLDHSVGRFMQLAEKSPAFANTIFVFFGDHEHPSRTYVSPTAYPGEKHDDLNRLHAPVIFYAPNIITTPKLVHRTGSIVDILPTLAGMAGIPYRNTGLGIDLLDDRNNVTSAALTLRGPGASPTVGMIQDKYYLRIADEKTKTKAALFDLTNPTAVDISEQFPDLFQQMNGLANGIFETSRYLIFRE